MLNKNQYDVRLETLYLFRAISPWCSPLCPRVLWQVIQFSSYVQNHMNLALKLSLSKSQSEKPTNFSADLVAMSWWNRRWSMSRTCMETRWVVPKIDLHLKYFSFPQKFTWRHKLFIFNYSNMSYQSSNALLGQIASPTCRFLGGSCCCTWPSTSAPPTWLETKLTIFVHFSILVHHGINWACKSRPPRNDLCTSYLAGDKVKHICPFVHFGTPWHYLGL